MDDPKRRISEKLGTALAEHVADQTTEIVAVSKDTLQWQLRVSDLDGAMPRYFLVTLREMI